MRDDVARAAAAKAIEIAQKALTSAKPGPAGPAGPKGEPGLVRLETVPVPGPQGEKGEKGDRGSTGPVGPYGAPGPKGAKGDLGPVGPQGERGPTGPAGKDGADGMTGAPGPIGPQGLPGPIGPMPKHERKGLMFRFEKAPGQWGDWIVVPTGGGGGRDDKLTDRQAELVSVADLIKQQSSNAGKALGTDGTSLQWVSTSGPFTSPIQITVNSTLPALSVTQTGTGPVLLIEDATSVDSTPTVIDFLGNLILGNSSRTSSVSSKIEVHSQSNETFTSPSVNLFNWNTSTTRSSVLAFVKSSSGTVGLFADNVTGEKLGEVAFSHRVSSVVTSASIRGKSSGGYPILELQSPKEISQISNLQTTFPYNFSDQPFFKKSEYLLYNKNGPTTGYMYLTTNGLSVSTINQVIVPENTTVAFYGIVALRDTTSDTSVMWEVKGSIGRSGSSAPVLGNYNINTISEIVSPTTLFGIQVDAVNNALTLYTFNYGFASSSMYAAASINTVEVTW